MTPAQRGEARARAAIAQGIADLREAAAAAPEWKTSEKADGVTKIVEPTRAQLTGMLAHIEESQARRASRAAA